MKIFYFRTIIHPPNHYFPITVLRIQLPCLDFVNIKHGWLRLTTGRYWRDTQKSVLNALTLSIFIYFFYFFSLATSFKFVEGNIFKSFMLFPKTWIKLLLFKKLATLLLFFFLFIYLCFQGHVKGWIRRIHIHAQVLTATSRLFDESAYDAVPQMLI